MLGPAQAPLSPQARAALLLATGPTRAWLGDAAGAGADAGACSWGGSTRDAAAPRRRACGAALAGAAGGLALTGRRVPRGRREGCCRRCTTTSVGAAGGATASRRRAAGVAPAVALAGLWPRAALQVHAAAGLTTLGNEALGVDLPESFTWREKSILIPTHLFEQRVTANEPYSKWVVGVTVDEVLANSLSEVGTADEIAQRIANLERDKDGNLLTEVLSASRGDIGGVATDTIEYRADTTRGFNHYLVRVALENGRLYNVTSQAPEDQWPKLEISARALVSTLRLNVHP